MPDADRIVEATDFETAAGAGLSPPIMSTRNQHWELENRCARSEHPKENVNTVRSIVRCGTTPHEAREALCDLASARSAP